MSRSESGHRAEEHRSDFRALSDHQVVELCRKDEQPAWEEFFRRFQHTIELSIQETLKDSQWSQDPDRRWDLLVDVFIRIRQEHKLRQCENPGAIRPWLREVAKNQALDHLRSRSTRERLPEESSKKSAVSLDAPLRGDIALPLIDVLADDNEDHHSELGQFVEKLLDGIEGINNEKMFWILRLSIVSRAPFSKQEIERLASFRGRPVIELEERLQGINEEMEKKEHKRLEELGLAIILWHELRRLEASLSERSRNPLETDREIVHSLERKIEDKGRIRTEHLNNAHILNKPSNRQIAEIVGLPEEKANQVSSVLMRAREWLQKKGYRDRA